MTGIEDAVQTQLVARRLGTWIEPIGICRLAKSWRPSAKRQARYPCEIATALMGLVRHLDVLEAQSEAAVGKA